MLSASEIIAALDADSDARLSVIPEPKRGEIESRSATSIDLRLGRWFRSFRQTHTPSFSLAPPDAPEDPPTVESLYRQSSALSTKQHFIPFGDRFVVHPRSFVLGATLEWLDVPHGLSAYVTGKSTLGRHGLIIETASGIHPGFSGCLTLELANVGEIPLEIFPGMKICQIFFHKISGTATSSPGVASGQRKPALPLQSADDVFTHLLD